MKEQQHRPDQENITESIDVEEFMAKYDRESDYARYSSYSKWIVVINAISFSLFSFTPPLVFRCPSSKRDTFLYDGFGLLYPLRNPGPEGVFTNAVTLIAVSMPLYVVIFYKDLVMQAAPVDRIRSHWDFFKRAPVA